MDKCLYQKIWREYRNIELTAFELVQAEGSELLY